MGRCRTGVLDAPKPAPSPHVCHVSRVRPPSAHQHMLVRRLHTPSCEPLGFRLAARASRRHMDRLERGHTRPTNGHAYWHGELEREVPGGRADTSRSRRHNSSSRAGASHSPTAISVGSEQPASKAEAGLAWWMGRVDTLRSVAIRPTVVGRQVRSRRAAPLN